ncbi:MAG: flagellar biosynthesis regulator FlaF [Planctomycetota bacterium]
MTAHHAGAGYGSARTVVNNPRQIEYQAFAQVTHRMRDAQDFPVLADALHRNLKLWTLIAADVAGQGNALPEALRAQLFYLAEFTRTHTASVLRGDAEAGPLVEINLAVMKGLRGQRDDTSPGEAEQCPA